MDLWTLPPDPFKALGLERSASHQEIKSRYYFLARRYHPNRNHGTHGPLTGDKTFGTYFTRINEAWTILSSPVRKRRYLEMVELVELQDEVETTHMELEFADREASGSEDWSSSDAEDYDMTHLSSISRARSPAPGTPPVSHVSDGPATEHSPTSPSADGTRGRAMGRWQSFLAAGKAQVSARNEAHQATMRRKKLHKYKRRELDFFCEYRDAMVAKIEAEMEAERRREQYETLKWKRQKIEIPIPTSIGRRVRKAQQMHKVVNIFKSSARAAPPSSPLQRKPTLSLRAHVLSSNDAPRGGEFLTVSSPSMMRGPSNSDWKGYSSDVSGDQTSSDDNGIYPVERRSLRSPSAVARRRMPHPNIEQAPPSRATPPPTPPSELQQNGNGKHVDDVTFAMLVKRPTGFEGHDCNEDADSASQGSSLSRSTSPRRPLNTCRDLIRYKFSNDTDAGPGGSKHRRVRSAPGQVSFVNDSDPDLRLSVPAGPMLRIKTVGKLRFPDHIPHANVHLIPSFEEYKLLKPPPETDANPDQLLERLHALDEQVAGRFMIKPDIKNIFKFRLICHGPAKLHPKHGSFIALSYRRRLIVKKHVDHFSLPLDKEMLQAVWDERIAEDEGLWVDQICIDQGSDDEKSTSMSAMDMVYRSARLVVVVLDDVDLKEHEGVVLENHARAYENMKKVAAGKRFRRQEPPFLEGGGKALLRVLQKVLSSSWFRRAWCRHEMRLARDHLFLLPCHTSGSFRQSVIRLTSSCIAHLLALAIEVPFDANIELLKPALHAFFRDRTEPSASGTDFAAHHGNFTTVVAEVFGMETGGDPRLPAKQREADALRDKVSIILNTMECGLALRPELRSSHAVLSKQECYYSLLMLALAARDPGALCSVGKPMILPPPEEGYLQSVVSFLFEPTNVDAGLNNYRTLNRLPADSHITCHIAESGEHFINLDLKFLRPDNPHPPGDSTDDMTLARSFMETCEAKKVGRQRKRYLIHDTTANENFGPMREIYIETLACVFACGPDWMRSVCQRYGVSRYREDLVFAFYLMVSLRTMNNRWPPTEWAEQAASFIMDFVNFLVIRGMPRRQLTKPEKWRPVRLRVPGNGQILTFCPAEVDVQPVVPTVLLDADYVHLARLWLVMPRPKGIGWTLVGKSVMFSDDAALASVSADDGMLRVQQRVSGRGGVR
ncbi:hypothetical protein B0A48_10824 [Cryoendolithus antarcticus]|uniref:J domain-containing protein n=1 Tax=Cryoendolithus antarcticus TaxID=1507870 RepID=A0A1V8SYQ7_9PEZI|nr:hypothetical protein B0A48_10824 [Cryoendolithus antarcticus]